jgi:hypothetical protein
MLVVMKVDQFYVEVGHQNFHRLHTVLLHHQLVQQNVVVVKKQQGTRGWC